ncbi:MAG: DUF1844 domain-containing protein [Acidimicrobiales bacterium]
MSSLWTPDGERPVAPPGTGGPPGDPGGVGGGPGGSPVDAEAMAAQVEEMREELANAPVEVVVANHCYGLFELSAVYLSQVPPLLPQARLAIDALAALVTGLEGRLGESEEQLKDGLSQLRLAYVQIDGARRAADQAASGAAPNGAGGEPAPGTGDPGPAAESDTGE